MKFAAAAALILSLTGTADPADDVWDVVANMAASLAEPNPDAFMKPIAKSFDQYDHLAREVRALAQANQVVSSISLVSNSGDDKQRSLEVDWYMQIHTQGEGSKTILRRENIKLTLIRTGRRWQVASVSPVEFFAHPNT